jgi:PDZ domain-containing protein
MRRFRSTIGIGLASTLIALAASGHVVHGDQEGASEGSWIGVKVKPLSEMWRSQAGYQGSGVLVTGVREGGPADQAGIVMGDVLVAAGSVSLWSDNDLGVAKRRAEPGEPVSVVISRNNGQLIKIVSLKPGGTADSDAGSTLDREGDAQATLPPSSAAPEAPEAASPDAASPEAASPESESVGGADIVVVPEPVDARAEEPSAPAPKAPADQWASFGAQCADLNSDLASALNVPVSRGVLVLQVTGGTADRVGIRAGDVITAAGDKAVKDVAGLKSALEGAAKLTLHVQRGDTERDVAVSLETPPTPGSQADSEEARDQERQAMRNELQTLQKEVEKLRAQIKSQLGE